MIQPASLSRALPVGVGGGEARQASAFVAADLAKLLKALKKAFGIDRQTGHGASSSSSASLIDEKNAALRVDCKVSALFCDRVQQAGKAGRARGRRRRAAASAQGARRVGELFFGNRDGARAGMS